jgi:hypothetical protein
MEKVETTERKYSAGKNNPLRNFGRQLATLGNLILIF